MSLDLSGSQSAVMQRSAASGATAVGQRPGAITLDRVSKVYDTRRGNRSVEALRGVSLSVQPGEFVAFLGPSGCGKSTLLKMVAGLVAPTSGSILIDGTPAKRPRPSVGVMFQTPELFPWRTVLQNVLLPVDVRGDRRSDYVDRAHELLRMVGIDGFEQAYPRELSGGMQQRVALCRTLLADPSVLLLDEPFGALDELTRERLNLELLNIAYTTGKTVVFVTHNIFEAVFLADRVVVMGTEPGRILADLPVPLPRPRTTSYFKDPDYLDIVFTARGLMGLTR
jgi:NitT/TauT family transport system ATP-binding protein